MGTKEKKQRVTVTLPGEVVREIDRRTGNRSRFVLEAVEHEIERRRREELRVSLEYPHPESEDLAEEDLNDWAEGLPEDDASDLVDPEQGRPVRWVRERGWGARDE